MKALVIDEPWIGKVLRGEKLWEMRKTACHQPGRIALIRKGSGLVVGAADLVDSLSPIMTAQAYAEAAESHGIPPDRQDRAFRDGWTTPWVLASVRPLASPVSYPHPLGAVIWVSLNDAVTPEIIAQTGIPASSSASTRPQTRYKAETLSGSAKPRPAASSKPEQPNCLSAETRLVVVTGGNIRNNQIYLPLDFFPDDAIGGSNKAAAAPRSISITFKPGATVETDVDRSKRILRTRGPVGDFLARACVNDGDTVLITRHSLHAYTISELTDV